MILVELFSEKPYSDPSKDQSIPKLGDVRKIKLTLAQINTLRKITDVRKFEKKAKLIDIRAQYGQKGQEEGNI